MRTKGFEIETYVSEYLLKQGIEILVRNFSCKMGEIDIICAHSETVVFIEVRYRKNTFYGSAVESVNYTKQQKLIRTARYYLMHHSPGKPLPPCRFDIIGISPKNNQLEIEWIQDAFQS